MDRLLLLLNYNSKHTYAQYILVCTPSRQRDGRIHARSTCGQSRGCLQTLRLPCHYKRTSEGTPRGINCCRYTCRGRCLRSHHTILRGIQGGIDKVIHRYHTSTAKYEIPAAVREFIQVCLSAVGAKGYEDFELYPGSPLLANAILRKGIDEHRLTDLYFKPEGLDKSAQYKKMDAFDPEALEFLMPKHSEKHNLVLIDAPFKNDEDYGKVRALMEQILERNPKAAICVWIPFIHGHRMRWSFATSLREIAKDKAKLGRYYSNIVIAKEGLQGSAMLVCNPSPMFDDVMDPKALHWLANTMQQGRDEYTVEQIMKKKGETGIDRSCRQSSREKHCCSKITVSSLTCTRLLGHY